jgi:exopolysaccharide biosynthesis polyprenyl glycosylphosphotransferase
MSEGVLVTHNRTPVTAIGLVMVIDILLLNGAVGLAYLVKFGGAVPFANLIAYGEILPWTSLIMCCVFYALGLYGADAVNRGAVSRGLLVGVLINAVSESFLAYWLVAPSFPRSVVFITMPVSWGVLFLWRLVLAAFLRKRIIGTRALLVGEAGARQQVWDALRAYPGGRLEVVAEARSVEVTDDVLARTDVDMVLIASNEKDSSRNKALEVAYRRHLPTYIVPTVPELLLGAARVTTIGDKVAFQVVTPQLSQWESAVKRAFDIVLSLLGIVLSSPLMLMVAVAVKVSSPGSVFYLQDRVGLGGRVFRVIKFRSMYMNAEARTGAVLALRHDPRVTPVGRIIRAARIDELPQLINVLKGDMSLVGPRPERPEFVRRFMRQNAHYEWRHNVRPGITGLAQVAGQYTTSPDDKLMFDLLYIQRYSILLDFEILLKTMVVILNRESSAGTVQPTAQVEMATQQAAAGADSGN